MNNTAQTIKLKAAQVQLFSKTFELVKSAEEGFTSLQKESQEKVNDLQRQLVVKQDEIKALKGRLEGVLLGVLTAEGVDLEKSAIRLKEDFTEIYVSENPPITNQNGQDISSNQDII